MGTNTVKSSHMIDMCWHLVLLFAAGVGMSVLPDIALAGGGGGGGDNAIQQVFCNVVVLLTGTTGKAVATVAIIAVGCGALLGKVSWGMALIVALGVALIFGAASIVNALGGSGGTCSSGSLVQGT